MKFVLAALMSLSAFSALAVEVETDLYSTLKRIETENNAKCTETGRSRIQICSGAYVNHPRLGRVYGHGYGRYNNAHLKTCSYAIKYNCVSNTGDFDIKLRIVEGFNEQARMRVADVRKIIWYTK